MAAERASLGSVLSIRPLSINRTRAESLGGYIDDVLAGSDKLLGQQRTHAGGALDRPSAGLEPSGPLEEPCALMTVGANA